VERVISYSQGSKHTDIRNAKVDLIFSTLHYLSTYNTLSSSTHTVTFRITRPDHPVPETASLEFVQLVSIIIFWGITQSKGEF
jgi:hypothetical protein